MKFVTNSVSCLGISVVICTSARASFKCVYHVRFIALPISIQSFTISEGELETLFHQATFLICSPTLMGYRPSSPSTANVVSF